MQTTTIATKLRRWIYIAIGPLLACLFIWLPFGFSLGPVIEEWDVLAGFIDSGPIYFVRAGGPFEVHRLRPLTLTPHAIAYTLDPHSFTYWHVLLIISIFLKGIAAYGLARSVGASRTWSRFTGVLLMLIPIDTMQMSFRAFHINWSMTLALLAPSIFLNTMEKRGRLWPAFVATFMFAAAMLAYETAAALVFLPFIALYMREGLKNGWNALRARWVYFAVWMLGPICDSIYVKIASKGAQTYQESLGGGPLQTLLTIVKRIPVIFTIALPRVVLGAWYDAGRIYLHEFQNHWYTVLAALVLIAWIFSFREDAEDFKPRHRVRIFIGGFVLFAMGYAPYLASYSHTMIDQRTYLFASMGGAFGILALISFSRGYLKFVAGFLAAIVLCVSLSEQIFQYHHYSKISLDQRRIIGEIYETMPQLQTTKTLAIQDFSGYLGDTWFLRDSMLSNALTFVTGHRVATFVCAEPDHLMSSFAWDLGRPRCFETAKGWTAKSESSGKTYLESPESNQMHLVINREGKIDAPHLRSRPDLLKPVPPPVELNLFAASEKPSSDYRTSFGDYWSMDLPTRGSGWGDSTWLIKKIHHKSLIWANQPHTVLVFDVSPQNEDYQLQLTFGAFGVPDIQKSIKVSVNSKSLDIKWVNELNLTARIPAGVLADTGNLVEIFSAMKPGDYGYTLDELVVKPTSDYK